MKIFLVIMTVLCFMFSTNLNLQSPKQAFEAGLFTQSCIGESLISGHIQNTNGEALVGVNVLIESTSSGAITDHNGFFKLTTVASFPLTLQVSYTGYKDQHITLAQPKQDLKIQLTEATRLEEIFVTDAIQKRRTQAQPMFMHDDREEQELAVSSIRCGTKPYYDQVIHRENTEQYGSISENTFKRPLDEALSTFSVDVDRAGYSNVRRFINQGQIPPKEAIRIEEMINYFNYNYEQPKGTDPLAMHTRLTECPWNQEHQVLHIGMQAKEIAIDKLPASNLVFLIDVSGSMSSQNKLPLLKSSFKLLLHQLRPKDRVAIVTYAGRAGVLLKSTPASEKAAIVAAIESLGAGGSTAGEAGIKTAYSIAKQHFIKDGNNRVILASDGDFNVGISSNDGLQSLIEKERKSGVFLSVLGFGMGNYKDEYMETLADKGNGNYAYVDNIQEARKVFVHEFGGTLFTLAKDVKLQIEFNPAYVQAYRLIGYENRLLNKEDFNDDTKDAGEIGSGHVVTALYEIIPVGSKSQFATTVDALKYQDQMQRNKGLKNNELATIKFRYKKPDEDRSQRIVTNVSPTVLRLLKQDSDVQFSLAVAQFGMLLRESKYAVEGSYDQVVAMAKSARGEDKEGYRSEFIRLVNAVKVLQIDFAEK